MRSFAALAGTEGFGEIVGYHAVPTLASMEAAFHSRPQWVLIAKIDTSEPFAPIDKLGRDLIIWRHRRAGGAARFAIESRPIALR